MVPLKLTATQWDALTFPRLPSILSRKQCSISVSPCYLYQGIGGSSKSKVPFPICSIQNVERQAVVDNHERSSNKVPDLLSSIKLKHVKQVYHYLISNSKYLLVVPLVGLASTGLSTLTLDDIIFLWSHLIKLDGLVSAISCSALVAFFGAFHLASRPKGVYLVDYSCYKPEPALKTRKDALIDMSVNTGSFTKEAIAFQRRVMERSGIGDNTYLPKSMLNPSIVEARKEAESVMFGAIDELLEKAGIKAKDIGILVVNCSVFNPTPSLSAMIVNHYKLRSNILSYNLGGMGCSAGIISIDLANQLLQVNPNSYALVVTTENITLNWYHGNDRSMLLSNCLFRMGAAAVLLSNRPSDRRRSKYELLHVVRTHMGADDRSYNCITQREDDADLVGVSLSKELMSVAGKALKTNITTLGPLVLPLSEQLFFLATQAAGKFFGVKKIKPYVPDFKLAFEHFCIHAGGKAVLDEIEKSLELTDWHMEPSKMTLYRYGNTSSSSVWYELAYTEAKGRIKKGDRAWQIGFGSGFKCNSAVWRALRKINPAEETNPWMDEIDEFPVRASELENFAHHSSN